ncbi:AMP-binding protein [Williamsia sp. SKLECPSW1]
MPIPDDVPPAAERTAGSPILSLSADVSAAVHAVAVDHRIEPITVVAAALVAYRGPGPESTAPRVGVAVSGGSRIAPVDLPVGARHSASGLVVRVGACVDSPVDPDPCLTPRDVVVAEGAPADATAAVSSVPVVVWCRAQGAALTLQITATTSAPTSLQTHLRRFAEFLGRFAAAGRTPVGSLQIVSRAERSLILDDWNDTAEIVAPATLVDLVEMGMARDPDRAAVVTPDGVLTHGDVDRSANRLARALLASGVTPGAVVGVLCDATAAAIVATVAVLRAGGAVLMLSTRHRAPETIVRIAEARATRVVTDCPVSTVVPPWVEIVALDDELDHHPDEPISADDGVGRGHLQAVAEVGVHSAGDELVALAYSHEALVNRLAWTLADWESDRGTGRHQVLVPADAHRLRDVCDVLWPVILGATAHTTVGQGIDRPTAGTGTVVEAGGAAFRVGEADRPGWNVEAYVLDEHLRLVPPGAPGDLYVGGVQVALGRPRDTATTADHFVANPFRPGERMVRVGSISARGGVVADGDVLRRVVAAVGVFDADGTQKGGVVADENRPARSGNPTR